MPAKSKQQQKFFGVVKAMQKGDIPKKGEAGEVADDMTKKEVDKMASTKHKGLPAKIKELIRLELNKTLKENRLTEVSANALRTKYEKAVKKEQALSSLLLVNLEKYKAAKAKGDEKAIAKHTKIAGQIGKKKAKATAEASAAYKAYEDKISGLYSDAELELQEDNKKDIRFDLVMSDEAYDELFDLIARYVEDPDDVEKELDMYDAGGFDNMSNMVTANLDRDKDYKTWKKKYGIKEGKLTEGADANRWFSNLKYYYQKGLSSPDLKDPAEKKAYIKLAKQFFSKLNELSMKGKDAGNFIKMAKAGKKLTMNGKTYTALGKGKWKGPDGKKLNWIQISSMASALGNKEVMYEALPKFKTPYEAFSWIMGKREEAMDIETEMLQTTNDIIQTQQDMEQEASPEGGPTTDRYGSVLNKLELKHKELRKQFAAIMAEIDEYDQNYM